MSMHDRAVQGRMAVAMRVMAVAVPVAAQQAAWGADPGEPPKVAWAAPRGETLLLLEAVVNGAATGHLLTVSRDAAGRMSARAAELRSVRIRLDGVTDGALVPLATLPGVAARYDEAGQRLLLQAEPDMLATHVLGLQGQETRVDLDRVSHTPGVVLNYSLYGSLQDGRTHRAANVELAGMTRVGVLSSGMLYNSDGVRGDGSARQVRLDTAWRIIDAKAIRSYTAGDFVSNALAWSNSVRLAGVQIASAFEQRTDIVTTPLPRFSGAAALPSSLDLYVNQQRVYSGEVPAGPFDIRSLPYIANGDVRLVTTDALGRQVETTRAYYYVPGQLRAGLSQYSLDVGVPRWNYGARSDDYDDAVFATGSWRHGWSDALTLEGHAEASTDGLANAGAGMVRGLGGHGALTASLAGSQYRGRTGAQGALTLEGRVAGVRIYASTRRQSPDYADVARVSLLRQRQREAARQGTVAEWGDASAVASRLERLGFTFMPQWLPSTSINLNYSGMRTRQSRYRTMSVTVSRPLSPSANLQASAFKDMDGRGATGIYVGLTFLLDGQASVTASARRDGGRDSVGVQAVSQTGMRQGDVGWGLSNQQYEGGDAIRSAYASYRAPAALLRVQADEAYGRGRGSVQADGALVAAAGGLYAANRIGQAFAVVTQAGPGVEIRQGGVAMGRTDERGTMLLPDIRPYSAQQVFIDAATLPDGWEAARTELVAMAAYRHGAVLDFGARRVQAAVVTLRDRAGQAPPVGSPVRLEGGDETVVGYDGQVYVRGLSERNVLTVDLGKAGRCTARFAYDRAGPAQPQLGPVPCL